MSTRNLRRAANTALKTGVRPGLASDADYVEHVALAYSAIEPNCRASMTEFVLTLAMTSEHDEMTDPVIQQWVTVAGSAVSANDLFNLAHTRKRDKLLRLRGHPRACNW